MLSKTKLTLVAVIAVTALAGLTSSAGAVRLEARNGGDITADSLGRLTFDSTIDVACDVTLNGDLKTTITAGEGAQVGEIESGEVENCTGGSARILNETFPWIMSYNSHGSTGLDFTINAAAFLLTAFGSGCAYSGNPSADLGWTEVSETFTSNLVTSNGSTVMLTRRLSGLFNCPSSGRLVGSFELINQQTIVEI